MRHENAVMIRDLALIALSHRRENKGEMVKIEAEVTFLLYNQWSNWGRGGDAGDAIPPKIITLTA